MNRPPLSVKYLFYMVAGLVIALSVTYLDRQPFYLIAYVIGLTFYWRFWPKKQLDPALGLLNFAQTHSLDVLEKQLVPIMSHVYNLDPEILARLVVAGDLNGYAYALLDYYPTLPQTSNEPDVGVSMILMQFLVDADFEFILLSAGNQCIASKYKIDKNYKILKLEGEFNKHFTLYVPDGQQIDVLQLFDPDTMEDFMNHFWMYSFELTQGQLNVYREGFDLYTIAARPDLANSLDVLYDDAQQN